MKEKRERARKRRKGKEKERERERKETERHIFDFSELYWSVPSRWNCVEISWSTCSGSSAGADSREGRAVPIWSRRRRSTLTSTCIEGGGEALAAGRRVITWRRRSWWEKGWVFHIGGDVETLDFPRPAVCPPAHCASSGSPAEQPNQPRRSLATEPTWTFLQSTGYYTQSKNHIVIVHIEAIVDFPETGGITTFSPVFNLLRPLFTFVSIDV